MAEKKEKLTKEQKKQQKADKKADKKGITPLEIAQKKGHKETAKAISDFITVQNLPRDEKGRIIVKQKNTKMFLLMSQD